MPLTPKTRESLIVVLMLLATVSFGVSWLQVTSYEREFLSALSRAHDASAANMARLAVKQGPEAVLKAYHVESVDELNALADRLAKESAKSAQSWRADHWRASLSLATTGIAFITIQLLGWLAIWINNHKKVDKNG